MTKTDEQQTRKQKGISCFAIFSLRAGVLAKTNLARKGYFTQRRKRAKHREDKSSASNKKGTANRALLQFQLADL